MEKCSATCEILLETHSAFSAPISCVRLNARLENPVRILWDAHHTWRSAGESPSESWNQIGEWVRHVHFSDSQSREAPTGYDCVLPGTGEYPVEALRELLWEKHYAYGISLEWERLWHPELGDVREALDQFQNLFRLKASLG
jgi:sugar phosphate isomerase/epimerase